MAKMESMNTEASEMVKAINAGVVEDIIVTLKRVRRSTRKGRRGLLYISEDGKGDEVRWWIPMMCSPMLPNMLKAIDVKPRQGLRELVGKKFSFMVDAVHDFDKR